MAIYYVNNSTGNNGNDGLSTGQPWGDLPFALAQLEAGDVLNVVETGNTYTWLSMNSGNSISSGTAIDPITVQAYSGGNPVISDTTTRSHTGISYWIWDGLTFNNHWGCAFFACTHWTIRNCTHEHTHTGAFGYMYRHYDGCNNITYEDSVFDNLRSYAAGVDYQAIYFQDASGSTISDIVIQRNTFRDIGADPIHIDDTASMTNVAIKDNLFEVVRPYQYREPITGNPAPDPNSWNSVGENFLDIKSGQGFVIEGNTFRGCRPAIGQDASNDPDGSAIIIHQRTLSTGHIIRKNWFEDCTGFIQVNGGQAPNAVAEISNNIFYNVATDGGDFNGSFDSPYAIRMRDFPGTCKIENNTFRNVTAGLPLIEIDEDASQANGLTVRNNIFDNGYIYQRNNANPTVMTSDYNLWANQSSGPPAIWTGPNDVYDDTPEINYTDFRPEATSSVRGAGTDAGYATDYYGTAITAFDIGAVQYVGPSIIPPTVDAGGPYSGDASTAIQLDGTVTPGSDPSPTLLWTIVSGGTGTFSNNAIEDPTFTPDSVGPYVLRLSADPSDGSPVTDDANLTSNASAPTVDAGGPYAGQVSTAIQLSGSFTPGTDPSPTLLWTIVSGGGGTFSDAAIANPTFTPDTVAAYTLRFSVDPSDGPAVTDDASLNSVSIPSTAPTVDAGGPYIGIVSTPIQLAGTVNPGTDPDPSLKWSSQGAGTFSDDTIVNPTFTPTQVDANYVMRLTVTPNDSNPVFDESNLNSQKEPGPIEPPETSFILYPSTFACPTWMYGTDTTPYPLRAQFDNGWTRQRRAFPETGMSANLTFSMSTTVFLKWSTWMEANGWNWFLIGLDDGEGTLLQQVRLITSPTWGYDNFDNITAQITVEVAPDGCREESTSG